MAQLKSAAEKKASPLLALIFFVLAAVGAALYVAHGSVAFIVMAIVMMPRQWCSSSAGQRRSSRQCRPVKREGSY